MPLTRPLVMMLACLVLAQAAAQSPPRRIRGDVVAIDGSRLQIRAREGDRVDVTLADNYTVTAVVPLDIGAIKAGTFVGTVAMPQPDGSLRALEVLVFPEAGRGSNEGHFPWDLRPGSMMTNATVAEVVDVAQDRRITLRYKGGEKVVTVPAGAPVVTAERGERSMLKPGAHVFIFAAMPQPDGSYTAARVTVGKDGVVPPM